jgi:DNA polymerase-1
VLFARTGEVFLLRNEHEEVMRACLDACLERCSISTYHAQDVTRAALDAGARALDPSSVCVRDCRIDAWLANADRAFEGGIDEVASAFKARDETTIAEVSGWGKRPLERLRKDMQIAINLCAKGKTLHACIAPARLVEHKVAVALGVLEHHGIGFDRVQATAMKAEARRKMDDARSRAIALIGEDINLASAQQVSEVLYKTLALPVPSAHASKGAKTSHLTTGVDALTSLASLHAFPNVVLDYRGALKEYAMCDGYVKAAVGRGKVARIHTRWNNTKTATGRLSSSNPNIQQVGRGRMRDAFVPQPGRVFLSADYSQIELRVLAHLCEDEKLIELLRKAADAGGDVFVAIWNAGKDSPPNAVVDSRTREIAKRTAYGIVYGQTQMGLAEKLNVSKTEAKGYIDAFHRAFPRVRSWISGIIQDAERKGAIVCPISGRHRGLPHIHSKSFSERSEAQRQSVNTVIQGTAADMMKMAMLRWFSACGAGDFASDVQAGSVDASRIRLIAQIHDELLFEVEESYVDAAIASIRACMECAVRLAVPCPVKISIGTSWGALEERK